MIVAIVGNAAETMLNFRSSLLSALVERGHEVYAFAPDYDASSIAKIRRLGAIPIGYRLNRAGMNPINDLLSVASLLIQLQRIRPDALLCYFIKPAIYGTLAGSLARVPYRIALIEGLGYTFAEATVSPTQRLIQSIGKGLLRFSLARAHKVLVLNADDARELKKQCRLIAGRVEVVGGIGVDLREFQPMAVRRQTRAFIMASRLIREKGVLEFLEAARRLRPGHPAARFILVGATDQNPHSLKAEDIEHFVHTGVVEWPGYVSDVRAWLGEADVFVLPSYYREGVPRSIQEAMALGRPIITTDSVGCRDTVEEGVNGFLVPPRDVEALTEAMRRFLTMPGLATRMGRASRRLAEQRFDAAKFDSKIIGLVERRENAE